MKLMKLLSTAVVLMASALPPTATATTSAPMARELVTVKTMAARDVRIIQTSARQQDKTVLIDGHLQRKKTHGRVIPKGHIDIAIIDETGKTIRQTFAQVSPEIIPRFDGDKSTFTAQIPGSVPQGGHVRVRFHCGPHES